MVEVSGVCRDIQEFDREGALASVPGQAVLAVGIKAASDNSAEGSFCVTISDDLTWEVRGCFIIGKNGESNICYKT